ncbi:tRNA uridine(34) 5-carboxymethylaminomethyl modification radical SAM/GNAT enzyme Elp3 [Candidatus Woesearchaeota archaeon CG_4_10_14_0_2_um_filter_33_13]|nr:MAG: tRNA uridine(34) 5-carboxymethylaminomethyl modification radical SAM/GNAT enzyme Elp3 [Candidatus Woesearchaeota archaeon CG_4_10_14_0_2_um_filter_33_13]
MDFYSEIIEELKKRPINDKQWAKHKRDLALKYKLNTIPTNIEILLHTEIKDIPKLKKFLLTKPVRSISGVAPVAIMSKPMPCPHALSGVGPCTMCPGGPKSVFGEVPQSYTGKEPATMRGIRNKYDSYLQVFNRLEQYVILGHNCEKVELILMGGTFPSFPLNYQEEFVKFAFKAMNDFSEQFYDADGEFDYLKFKDFFELPAIDLMDKERTARIQDKLLQLKGDCDLKQEQTKNQTTKIRCVALCIETRPDYGLLEQGNQMLSLGCTRVELGIQSVYDDVLKMIRRGHGIKESKDSIKILKDLGFKVAAHYMPGLPGVDAKRDLAGMKKLFSDSAYKPDMLKLYPCMVTKGTKLYQEFLKGEFQPLNADGAAELIVKFKKYVPEYCRIIRVQRDIPTFQIAAGVEMTNLRQYLQQHYNPKCRCIRCREPKGKTIDWEHVKIKVQEYEASGGTEFFISVEDINNDLLIGFLRLRFPSKQLRPEITKDSAIVRELHVYGTSTGIGEEGSIQHRGWGKKLMQKAEEICEKKGKNKIIVISGIGVREYYRKIGYHLEGPYMVKEI